MLHQYRKTHKWFSHGRKGFYFLPLLFIMNCAHGVDSDKNVAMQNTILALSQEYRTWNGFINTRLYAGGGETGETADTFAVSSGFSEYRVSLNETTRMHIEKLDFYLRDNLNLPDLSAKQNSASLTRNQSMVEIFHETEENLPEAEAGSPYENPFSLLENKYLTDPLSKTIELGSREYIATAREAKGEIPPGNVAAVVLHLYELELHGEFQDPEGNIKQFHIFTGPIDSGFTPDCRTELSPGGSLQLDTIFQFRHLFTEIGDVRILQAMDGLGTDPVTVSPYENQEIFQRIAANMAGTEIFREAECETTN